MNKITKYQLGGPSTYLTQNDALVNAKRTKYVSEYK